MMISKCKSRNLDRLIKLEIIAMQIIVFDF